MDTAHGADWGNGWFLVVFSFLEKTTYCCRARRLSVRPSVEIISFRGNSLSNRPVELKIGLNVHEGVVHVRKAWFFEILIASCKFMQFANKLVCMHGFDRSTNPILPKIDIQVRYPMMHVWKKFSWEIRHVSCIFMQLTIFLQIAMCARFWLIYTNPILMKIDINLRFVIMHVWNCRFLKFTIGNCN